MKILYVDLESAWRGGQNQALLTMQGVQARGHEPRLISVEAAELGTRAAAFGVPVKFVGMRTRRIAAALAIRDAVRSAGIEIIHANEAHAVTATWLTGAAARIPMIVSRRVGYPLGTSWASKAKYLAAAKIVANSKWVAEQAIASGAAREKVTVVYEGTVLPQPFTPEVRAEARLRWGLAEDAPVLGCVGVLLPDKGQEWLIRATAGLRGKFPGIRLLLAGDGISRPGLEALAAELNVSDAVIFAGFVSNIQSVYAALDVFLLPSLFEALNNSLLAAMAYEIPSIAFDRGALSEIIEDGASGILVSGPVTQEIETAVSRVLDDRQLAQKLGQAARLRVQHNFSAERMVEDTLKVYEEALVPSAR